jgi:anti-sigma factor (TIGR02949 family)
MNQTNHCHNLISTLSDYIDGELEPELCSELEHHLANCDNCRIVVNTLRKTIDLYKESSEPEQLPEDVRQRLFYRLNLEDYIKPD